MLILILFIAIPLIIFIIEIVILIDVIQNPNINNNSKILWILLLLFTNILGLVIYLVSSNKNILQ
ncbi:MAG: PLDc N-terminal domain-containing protein [Candidatus Izimaplasma sp.]|nr:PLDc N-terminal domain-containing protein [Candidatus Izimaplasma bacterium]